jgi:hypothetical protein
MIRTTWKRLTGTWRARITVALLAVLTAGLAWYFLTGSRSELGHRFRPGEQLVFRLEYGSVSAANLTGLTAGGEPAKDRQEAQTALLNLQTDLHATVLEANDDGAWVAFALANPEIEMAVNGQLALEQMDALKEDLGKEWIARVDARGRIRSLHLDSRVQSTSHTLVRALLAATQVVFPDDPAATAWETHEDDPHGDYRASYQAEPAAEAEPDLAVFSKRRTAYQVRKRPRSLRRLDVEQVARPEGALTIRFSRRGGHVQSVAGTEATAILVDGRLVARTETTLNLTFQSRETVSAAEQDRLRGRFADLKSGTAIALSTEPPGDAREAALQRSELGDATADSLLAELARLDTGTDAKPGESRLYLKLKALVYLQPEVCPRLARELSTARVDGAKMRHLADALSSVGHAAAQDALQQTLRARRADAAALAVLVPALAMVETPTLASEVVLREVAAQHLDPQVRASAELGLGTMAHQLAESERARGIVRDMAVRLDAATTAEARRHYLLVLGNAGAGESLERIARHLRAEEPQVRAAAAAALRWQPSARADELLGKTLASDAEAEVRVEAATALGFRTATAATFAVQKAVFANDKVVSVRLAVLHNLAKAMKTFPEARTVLTQAANDASAEVREEAAELLGRE